MDQMDRSSSLDLSSAPGSDTEPPPAGFSLHPSHGQHSTSTGPNPFMNSFQTSGARQDPTPAKKPRKPRTTKPKTDSDGQKPVRKPRAPNGTGPNSRKKAKIEKSDDQTNIQAVPPTVGLQSSRLVEPYSFAQNHPLASGASHFNEAAKTSQNGFSNPQPPMHQDQHYPSAQPTPPRVTSMYDPIRGSITVQDPPQRAQTSVSYTPPRPVSRSGASPISSLIDPPMPSALPAPSPLRVSSASYDHHQMQVTQNPPIPQQPSTAMELDGANDVGPRKTSIGKKASEPPTRAGSPKPTRAKEQPPPAPAGKGLLSASVFGGEMSLFNKTDVTATGPNIVLRVNLKDPNNQVISFARLAEEKYGFAALYPRQAAQKERLARIAAIGASLERSGSGSKVNSAGESGDDDAASVDIDRDSDNDGDVAMGGTNGAANSGTDAEPKKKATRRKKVEEYDLEDDFVDDSEQVWEAQAATSKEGFFVYCGPLVPEGEKATIERYAKICSVI